MRNVEDVAADKLLWSIAQDAETGRTGVEDLGLRAEENDPVGAVFNEGTETPIAGEEPLLSQVLLVSQPLPLQRP